MIHKCLFCGKEYDCTQLVCDFPYEFGYCSEECEQKDLELKRGAVRTEKK
jgi:hypothetical protein